MRICIDIDGTLCPVKSSGQSYEELEPTPGSVERVRELKSAGHTIILYTARNMATCEANVGRVLKNVGQVTLEWLGRHGFEYDEIFFGKPNAHVYIDDRALRFSTWSAMTDSLLDDLARER